MNYTVVGFGDSITEAVIQMPDESKRWLNLLGQKLETAFPCDSFKIINSGVGGNSDREKMQRFERDVLAHNPDFVLLEFGGNNSAPNDRKRRVSLQEAGLCLEEVKKRLSEKTQIALITFPPVIDRQHAFYGHEFFEANGGLNANLELYRNLTREFAEDNGYPLIDFYRHLKIKMEADGENVYTLSDGVHLTETGNRELAELVFITLNKLLKQEE